MRHKRRRLQRQRKNARIKQAKLDIASGPLPFYGVSLVISEAS
jgi:hypothetical protein